MKWKGKDYDEATWEHVIKDENQIKIFNEKESCLCCPQCGELIEDGDDNDDNS